jgi:hypothetical protein
MERQRPTQEKENQLSSVEQVDRAVNERLAGQRAGSPAIRAFGDVAAEKLAETNLSTTPKEDPNYHQYEARLEVIRETQRRENLGQDADLYSKATMTANLLLLDYIEGFKKVSPSLKYAEQRASAASRMEKNVRNINILKAEVQRKYKANS